LKLNICLAPIREIEAFPDRVIGVTSKEDSRKVIK